MLCRILVVRIGEEVARNKTSDAINLSHVEAIVIHVSVHVDDLTRLEAQLSLEKFLSDKKSIVKEMLETIVGYKIEEGEKSVEIDIHS